MKGDAVPDDDHISRLCSGITINPDGTVNGAAFQLRPGRPDEDHVSVNWLEFLELPNREAEISAIREVLASKLRLGAKAKLAVLNVGEMRDYVAQESPDNRNLRVLHWPEDNDPSHGGIYDLPTDDNLIADLIAETVREVYPARDPAAAGGGES